MDNERLTNREVANILGVHPATLVRWRMEGKGPAFVKVGTKVVYPKGEVAEWLASRVVLSEAA